MPKKINDSFPGWREFKGGDADVTPRWWLVHALYQPNEILEDMRYRHWLENEIMEDIKYVEKNK